MLLHYGRGFTAAEAAEVMGNEEATVRSQLRTGCWRVRGALAVVRLVPAPHGASACSMKPAAVTADAAGHRAVWTGISPHHCGTSGSPAPDFVERGLYDCPGSRS
ncbi:MULTISPECIES: hypothetical protein [unclassified Streptomyces]|uniref:hypothetical protein n=1 Tax=unclassified Streptomyces TaxID=2593676 RepID=UPI002E257581